jgi:hypothetical protein
VDRAKGSFSIESEPLLGKIELDWARFAIVMSLLESTLSHSGFDTRSAEAFLSACSVAEARAMYQLPCSSSDDTTARSQRFSQILEIIRGQQCVDDRDRIYALLSLRSPSTGSRLSRTTRKPSHMYTSTTRSSISSRDTSKRFTMSGTGTERTVVVTLFATETSSCRVGFQIFAGAVIAVPYHG